MKYICQVCNTPCRLDTGSEVEGHAVACPLRMDTAEWERLNDEGVKK